MWPYWILFLLPAVAAVVESHPQSGAARVPSMPRFTPGWALALTAITLMVGYRFEVGGDWFNYLGLFEDIGNMTFGETISRGDPGYWLLSWVSSQLGFGIYGVNLACGAMFTTAIVKFCRRLPRPWLALAVSVPYLILVLGMGYTRQGVALAFGILGLLALERGAVVWFVTWIILGATFHKTAVVLLPMAALAYSKNRYLTVVWLTVVTVTAYFALLADSVEGLMANYNEDVQSQGALVRLLMNAVPAVILLLYGKRLNLGGAASLWRWFAWISLLLLGILFAVPSSTVIDRLGLYMLPLQLVVFGNLPNALGRSIGARQGWVLAILLYYASVLFVWLNFAVNAGGWIPYRFYPFELI